MEYLVWARIIHVLGVIVWIGGVAMVTMVIIPAVKKLSNKENKIATFEKIEGKFANIAKVATVLTGMSGFYLLHGMQAWDRYLDIKFWWVHAMTLVWFIFTVILFILEPFVLHRVFRKYAAEQPEKTFRFMHFAHWILLLMSLVTIIGALAGSHGLYFF
ncbi:MAG TPA: hypothetical protein VFM70_02525 [Salinimicrobium sp.]|nr:hypothetical protein [Salinimicrobium sp.]